MIDTSNLVLTAPQQATSSIKASFDKIALIDADFIKYLTCSDISKYIGEHGYHPSEKMGPSFINHFVENQLNKQFFNRFDCKGMIFCFSGPSTNTFRYMVGFDKKYKGKRGLNEPDYPTFYQDLASVLSIVAKHHNIYIHHEYEADDVVSVLQNEHTFIYSRDKDLKQVPGNHYDVSKNQLKEISVNDANYSLCLQLLQGDSTDNITGIQGVGETTAIKLLKDVPINQRFTKVIETYVSKYGSIEGLDRFAEAWMLVKMRIARGGYEAEKLVGAYHMRDLLIKNNITNGNSTD